MIKATDIMSAAIENSIARCKELGSECAVGFAESHIGKITAKPIPSRNRNSLDTHRKMTWKLNGKVISGENLEKALNA